MNSVPHCSTSHWHLFNVSISTGIIPRHCKAASISPVPKIPSPANLSDFCPISITSVLSRVMEHLVVKQFIYPALLTPPPSLVFDDQFAFRPTNSHHLTVWSPLRYCHQSRLQQGVWHGPPCHPAREVRTAGYSRRCLQLVDGLFHRSLTLHEVYDCATSSLCQISASIVQGSAIGPVSYVVNASDLRAATTGNELCKYADDTYVIIPAANERSRCSELDHIQHWAKTNNLIVSSI